MAISAAPAAEPAVRSGAVAGARYALGLLVVVYVFNNVDRHILAILMEPIARDLGVSDALLGLLAGLPFALFYTLAGLPVARWADRGTRRTIIALALAVWSGMTALCGLAQSYTQLLLARVGVGIGEAGCTPPAHSLISDYFPPQRRATALSIYGLGISIGMLLGLALGGWIEQLLGWRRAFLIAGLPGVVLAVVVRLTLREPRRGQSEATPVDTTALSLGEAARFAWRVRALRHTLLGASLQTVVLAAGGAWNAVFLIRVHDLSSGAVGTLLGLIAGIAGGLGVFGGGWLGDRLRARDQRWYLWLPALGALGSIPFAALFYLHADPRVALACLVPATVLHHLYSALGHAVAQSLAKLRMRALISAVSLLMMNLIGFGLGPQLAGLASHWLSPQLGPGSLRYALLGMTLLLVWPALHYALAARSYRADVRARDGAREAGLH